MKIDLFGDIIEEKVEEVARYSKPSPFEFINKVSKKQYPDDLNGYNAYLINLAFSQRKDTVLYANELNKYHNLGDREQFDFYYYGLPKKNYFAKWAKMAKSDNTEMIMEYFSVSYKVAKQYEKVLTEKEISQIKVWYDNHKGGKE